MELEDSPKLAVVVCFMDEAEYLPTLLSTIADQTLPPSQLLLVDDGSRDRSGELATAFAADHGWARALRRPLKAPTKDRLASAAELVAFQWAVQQLSEPWDVLVKLDADLRLEPELFETIAARFQADERLGITGPFLSIPTPAGGTRRESARVEHVRGATKFYRRQCYEQISPVPPILGWDTIDELRARGNGWFTRSFALAGGDCIHLRPTGAYDGRLRAQRREGRCAWGYRSHPLWVTLAALYRMRQRPFVLGGVCYLLGWMAAGLTRQPRGERALGALSRREKLASARARVRELTLALAGS
jgi:poly-beta-1,6-N-acetyl-D-glucosamine synthase